MTIDMAPIAARRAAYVSAAAATIGFLPLHATWALGIPLFADPDRFDAWYSDGGGAYLWTLCALAVLPAVLALALVRPWGLVFPRWTPFWAGRRVPRMLLIAPGYALTGLLGAYMLYAMVLIPLLWNEPGGVFSPWTGLFGVAQFAFWVVGLGIATRSYARRTAPVRAARAAAVTA